MKTFYVLFATFLCKASCLSLRRDFLDQHRAGNNVKLSDHKVKDQMVSLSHRTSGETELRDTNGHNTVRQEQEASFADELYIDESFPADDSGVFLPWENPDEQTPRNMRYYFKDFYDLDVSSDPIVWLRPHELCSVMGWEDPQLVVDGFSIFDINQGRFGDCWFLGGMSHLPNHPQYMSHVISTEQNFGADYTGMFRVKLWHNGQWEEVTVDDRLPCETKDGQVVGLLGVSNPREPHEFWAPLVEKAYAKINGGPYEMIHGGWATDSMVDVSGGVSSLQDIDWETISDIKEDYERGTWAAVSRSGTRKDWSIIGLVSNHVYTLTEAREVVDKSGKLHQLVRLRNPYGGKPNNGMDVEWNGAWSDDSSEWSLLDDEVRAEMLQVDPRDGVFWMSFKDLVRMFEWGEYYRCQVFHSALQQGVKKGLRSSDNDLYDLKTVWGDWSAAQFKSETTNHDDDAFWSNPSYLVLNYGLNSVSTEPEVFRETPNLRRSTSDGSSTSNVVVSLTKSDFRKLYMLYDPVRIYNVSIAVFRLATSDRNHLSSSDVRLAAEYLPELSIPPTGRDIDLREVSQEVSFAPGVYVFVVSADCSFCELDDNLEFSLRLFTTGTIEIIPLSDN